MIYEVTLPYFKQGDDLQQSLQEYRGDVKKALEDHSLRMAYSHWILEKLMENAEHISIETADIHLIEVSVNDPEVARKLLEDGVISIPRVCEECAADLDYDDEFEDDDDGVTYDN